MKTMVEEEVLLVALDNDDGGVVVVVELGIDHDHLDCHGVVAVETVLTYYYYYLDPFLLLEMMGCVDEPLLPKMNWVGAAAADDVEVVVDVLI